MAHVAGGRAVSGCSTAQVAQIQTVTKPLSLMWRQFFDADDLDAEALRAHTIALLDRGIGAG